MIARRARARDARRGRSRVIVLSHLIVSLAATRDATPSGARAL
jgi:hypothetical protein